MIFTSASANEAGRIRPFTAKYSVENDYITAGVAYLSLLPDTNNNFDLTLRTKPKGVFKLSSKGSLREQAKMPSYNEPYNSFSYSYQDKGNRKRDYTTIFLRDTKKAKLLKAGKTQTITIDEPVTDRLSTMLVVMNELQQNNSFSAIDVQVLEHAKMRTMTFTNRGKETIKTAAGRFQAVRIHRGSPNSNRETVSWFAALPDKAALAPVRIEQFKNGKLTLRLELLEFSTVD
ncbi:hypothetical protein AB833_02840 [Chromatiales bacterium (ex Bugula neritina AB1)]|nr:hypothetical protein AB833_02840 [Chromatiales bacterium (ex Bugula neritina AB1)]